MSRETKQSMHNKDWLDQPYDAWAQPTMALSGDTPPTRCWHCGQHHLQKASMIHAAGTRHGTSTGPRYTVTHSSQTVMAAQYAPPSCPTPMIEFWAIVYAISLGVAFLTPVDWLVNLSEGNLMSWLGYKLAELALAPLVAYLSIRLGASRWYRTKKAAAQAAQAQWEADYAKWANTWVCRDCGRLQ